MYPTCVSSKLCEFISLLTAAFFFLFSHFRLNYFLPCLLCIASWVIFSIEWLVLKSYSFSSFGCFQLFSHFLAQKYSSLVCFFWGESFNKALMQHRPGQHLSNGLCYVAWIWIAWAAWKLPQLLCWAVLLVFSCIDTLLTAVNLLCKIDK